jgi:DNA replication and repair protein RecF
MDNSGFTSLRLQNFRSYKDFAVELSPNVNIVVGPNASGKTNLLESMLIICGVSSFRAAYQDVIYKKAKWSRIDANYFDGARIVKLVLDGDKLEKIYEINEKPKKRLNFDDLIPVVLFEPEDMRLLTGSPDLRREFFDAILTETRPEFSSLKNRYKRTLAQRNNLLKQHPNTINKQIFAWNVRLSELAGKIVALRVELIKDFKDLGAIYSKIANAKTRVTINYQTPLPLATYESSILKKLESNIERDVLAGFTTCGPHREDFAISINNHLADVVASRGETRTLVLSLKLLELSLLEKVRGQKPLILLDDVFSELDGTRRKALTEYLKSYQTIITTTDADIIQKHFAQSTNLISLG